MDHRWTTDGPLWGYPCSEAQLSDGPPWFRRHRPSGPPSAYGQTKNQMINGCNRCMPMATLTATLRPSRRRLQRLGLPPDRLWTFTASRRGTTAARNSTRATQKPRSSPVSRSGVRGWEHRRESKPADGLLGPYGWVRRRAAPHLLASE